MLTVSSPQIKAIINDFKVAPTIEQLEAINQGLKLESFKVMAYAGTGKTSTLMQLSKVMESIGKKGLYIAFNKSVAVEAGKRFAPSVVCKTFHSLAFGNVSKEITSKVFAPKLRPRDVLSYFDLADEDIKVSKEYLAFIERKSNQTYKKIMRNGGYEKLTALSKMQLIVEATNCFCKSVAESLDKSHFEKLPYMNNKQHEKLLDALLPIGQQYWDKLISPSNNMNILHDVYVKVWALTNPILDQYDYIMMDEMQDSDALMTKVLANQPRPVFYVGDKNQQIYAWRGAINTLQALDLPAVYLTESFRFGEQVASHANLVLSLLNETKPLRGQAAIDSQVFVEHEPAPKVDAILCRTNKGAFAQLVMQTIQYPERKFCLMADVREIRYWLESALKLIQHKPNNHPDLRLFHTWDEVIEYAKLNKADQSVMGMIRLLDQFDYNFDELFGILNKVDHKVDEPDCIICTVHKAKGLEWDSVLIADDFDLELMPNKFAGLAQDKDDVSEIKSDDIYLEDWSLTEFPNSLNLVPVDQSTTASHIAQQTILDNRMAKQRNRITECDEEELRLVYVAVTRAKRRLYAASFAEFFVLCEKLRAHFD